MDNFGRNAARVGALALALSAAGLSGAFAEGKQDAAAAAKGPRVVKYYSWESYFKAQNDAVAAKFEAAYPDVKVEIEYVGEGNNEEYLKKVDLMMMSGQTVDVVMQASFEAHMARAENGILAKLEDFLAADKISYDKLYTFDSRVDGGIYGLPGDVKSWFVMINKRHLEEAGLPVPPLDWTWEDYRGYAKKLTVGEGKDKRYGSYFHGWDVYSYLAHWTDALYNPFVKADGSLNFGDPLFKEFMNFRHQMEYVDKCQVPTVDAKSLNLNYRPQFYNGKVSMIPTGTWMIAEIKNTDKFPHDFPTVFAPLPRFRKATPPGRTNTEAMYYAVAANSKNKRDAYEFIKFYTTEGMAIKGTGFTAQRGGDKNEIITAMVGSDSNPLYDMPSLRAVMNNPKWQNNVYTRVPPYQAELRTLFGEESDKFLLGAQNIDQTIANIAKRAQDVASRSK